MNGRQEYPIKHLLNKTDISSNINVNDLRFAVVAQIENMLNKTIDTQLIVYNFGKYLGIVCKLYHDYYKSFIIYIRGKDKNAVDLNNLPNDITITYKNNTRYNNQHNWKNGFESAYISAYPDIHIQTNNNYIF